MPRSSSSDEQQERPYASLAQTASVWLFGLTVIGSALAIGTVHTTTLLIVAATAFAALALALYGSTTTGSSIRPTLSLPVITCGALALYTLLQALPLPVGLLRVIAPANADVWERALLPFNEPALRWASLSLDPGASVIEAVKWATYAAVFASATAISAKRGAAWGVTLVFTSAMLAAIITVAHGLAGATRVYGLYQPAFAASVWHIGPLLNPNNLAGYLNLGALAGLGLALTRKPVVPPWIIGVGVMLIVGVEVTSASRAGVFALPLGVLALALITRRQTGAGTAGRSLSIWIMVGAAAAGGTVLAALGGTRSTWTELYARDLSKIEMLLWAKPLLRDHPFFGIGRGAFESVFPVYRLVPGNLVFTHAENFPAQWASEWGVPVTLAAFVAFGLAFSPKRLGVDRSAVAAGAWMGVAVLLLQNMFDLALEVPAICIAAAA
ncbi:MAG: O-antigen ligase family protein, partial [Byssovorax sp.]